MKTKLKKNVANLNDQQQNRIDTQNEADTRANKKHLTDEHATGAGNGANAPNTPRQTAQSGRKSRDNFGSYKGY